MVVSDGWIGGGVVVVVSVGGVVTGRVGVGVGDGTGVGSGVGVGAGTGGGVVTPLTCPAFCNKAFS